jgi:hypothetical protein
MRVRKVRCGTLVTVTLQGFDNLVKGTIGHSHCFFDHSKDALGVSRNKILKGGWSMRRLCSLGAFEMVFTEVISLSSNV